MATGNEGFLRNVIHDDLRKRYVKDAKSEERRVKREYKRGRKESIERYTLAIERQDEHDKLVNLCVHPFTETSLMPTRLGYSFLRADPLFELSVRNFDFLIYRTDSKMPTAIFGEVKRTVESDLMRELKEKREIVEANIEYVKANYLGKTNQDIRLESVLAVPSASSIDAYNAISNSNEPVILWLPQLYDNSLKLGQPPDGQPQRARMSHYDNRLMKALSVPVSSSAATFDFFPQSHTVRKLKALLSCSQRTPQGLIVDNFRLSQFVKGQLFYLDDNQRSAELARIVQEGERIGFLARFLDKPDLKIVSTRRKIESLERDLDRMWIEAALKEDQTRDTEKALTRLRSTILKEQEKRPSILSYTKESDDKKSPIAS
jgi:hypothetical protein